MRWGSAAIITRAAESTEPFNFWWKILKTICSCFPPFFQMFWKADGCMYAGSWPQVYNRVVVRFLVRCFLFLFLSFQSFSSWPFKEHFCCFPSAALKYIQWIFAFPSSHKHFTVFGDYWSNVLIQFLATTSNLRHTPVLFNHKLKVSAPLAAGSCWSVWGPWPQSPLSRSGLVYSVSSTWFVCVCVHVVREWAGQHVRR